MESQESVRSIEEEEIGDEVRTPVLPTTSFPPFELPPPNIQTTTIQVFTTLPPDILAGIQQLLRQLLASHEQMKMGQEELKASLEGRLRDSREQTKEDLQTYIGTLASNLRDEFATELGHTREDLKIRNTREAEYLAPPMKTGLNIYESILTHILSASSEFVLYRVKGQSPSIRLQHMTLFECAPIITFHLPFSSLSRSTWFNGISSRHLMSRRLRSEREGMRKVIFRGSIPVFALKERERVENHFGKTTLSTPDRGSSLDLPVIGSLVYCKSSALDHAAIEAEINPTSVPSRDSNPEFPVTYLSNLLRAWRLRACAHRVVCLDKFMCYMHRILSLDRDIRILTFGPVFNRDLKPNLSVTSKLAKTIPTPFPTRMVRIRGAMFIQHSAGNLPKTSISPAIPRDITVVRAASDRNGGSLSRCQMKDEHCRGIKQCEECRSSSVVRGAR
uniref:Uncharacterized protein n=1 Tax=Timema bartmani TaxID=61472 RepID=A0A7R9ERA0_9NEOP|nr:unnamed protein product [Timema bartmani]